jgi:histidinol-phosphate aminotransferase
VSKPQILDAYQWPPSTEALAAQVGLNAREILRFDGNVPPAPPASARPAALARALADVNEYDRGRYESLRSAIAARHDVGFDQVSLGAGSDEFIVLVARTFAEGGTVATVPSFSYSMYRYAALMAGARMIDDPAKADLVFVCRPNNPTGELPEIPDVPGQLVIDEAYADYAGVDALDRVNDGVIVLRTFSKAYGLAGARVGYALATPELTSVITSRQAPLSVSSLSAALALAALNVEPDVSDQIAERERLTKELVMLGLVALRSYTNFPVHSHGRTPGARGEIARSTAWCLRAYPGGLRISVRDELDDDSLARRVALCAGGPANWRTNPLRYRERRPRRCSTFASGFRARAGCTSTPASGFYDHMLTQLAFHGGMDLRLEGRGRPRDGRPPHGRGHDAHVWRSARLGAR